MRKCWSRLCFLVFAVSSLPGGQTEAPVTQNETLTTLLPDGGKTEASSPAPPTPSLQSNASGNETDVQGLGEGRLTHNNSEKVNGSTAAPTTASAGLPKTSSPAPTTAAAGLPKTSSPAPTKTLVKATSPNPGPTGSPNSGSHSWAYVVLGLILLVIIILCVILFLLRRVSRSYSFDLQRPLPTNHHNEPSGTFGQVYLDDLDPGTTEELSPPPASNGKALQTEHSDSSGEKDPQDQADTNNLESLPPGYGDPSPGDEQDDNTSATSANLFFDAIGEEQQNENNNNPSVCLSDPFVEINLEEPAWCDQLLTPPHASSVLPFSAFSSSSSSSSS